MADYYPLIARAVAGLEKNTGDARRGLYERARTALLAQLRSVSPALSENDITRERLALEESIRKVEAEAARKTWIDPKIGTDPKTGADSKTGADPKSGQAAPVRVRTPEFPRWDPPAATAHAAAADDPPLRRPPTRGNPPKRAPARPQRPPATVHAGAVAASTAPAEAAPGVRSENRYVDPVFDQPIPDDPLAPGVLAPQPHVNGQRRATLTDSGVNGYRSVVAETDDDEPMPRVARRRPAGPEAHYGETIADANASTAALPDYLAPSMHDGAHDHEEAAAAAARHRRDDFEHGVEPSRNWKDKIRIAAMLLVLAGVGGLVAWQWQNLSLMTTALLSSSSSSPADTQREASVTQKSSTKIPDRFEPGKGGAAPSVAQSPTLANAPTNAAPNAAAGAAVAQKVVLYEEDPNDPQGKRFVGSAIWRVEKVAAGPGQQPEVAIRADVEIPERKIAMTWSLRRNTDQSLPASHTVEIMFRLPQDFAAGSITNVPGILMKASEQTRGVPLAGLAVKVTNGFFLIGLSSSEADKDRNMQMLKDRQWFDIPVVYENNRRAILAVEKGTPGERAFAEAFAAWRQ